METYTPVQLQTLFQVAPAGWSTLAMQILLGTGMRLGELYALDVEDLEDDGEAMFLKIRRGKGAKFRRVPVSHRLSWELLRYINRVRPDSARPNLLLLRDGRPVDVECVSDLFQRLRRRVGFRVHAHKFRHTFATEYLRNGGEIERLRRILGHTTYVMVMRYAHLDKGDLFPRLRFAGSLLNRRVRTWATDGTPLLAGNRHGPQSVQAVGGRNDPPDLRI